MQCIENKHNVIGSGKHCYHGFLDWASKASGLACRIIKAMSDVQFMPMTFKYVLFIY